MCSPAESQQTDLEQLCCIHKCMRLCQAALRINNTLMNRVWLCRDSPFLSNNNSGGGFVGDRDLVALNAVEYESLDSSGGPRCMS